LNTASNGGNDVYDNNTLAESYFTEITVSFKNVFLEQLFFLFFAFFLDNRLHFAVQLLLNHASLWVMVIMWTHYCRHVHHTNSVFPLRPLLLMAMIVQYVFDIFTPLFFLFRFALSQLASPCRTLARVVSAAQAQGDWVVSATIMGNYVAQTTSV
jgi:hypothetical protein